VEARFIEPNSFQAFICSQSSGASEAGLGLAATSLPHNEQYLGYGLIFTTHPSKLPRRVRLNAPGVVGKFAEKVEPPT